MSRKNRLSKNILVPYCGIRNPPKNRIRGTLDQCLKAGQVRYYWRMAVENSINQFLDEKKKLAREKAKIKRQNANNLKKDAVIKINQAKVSVKQANKAEQEAKTAEKEAKKPRGRPKKNVAQNAAKKPRGRLPKNNNPFAKMILDNKIVRNLPIV